MKKIITLIAVSLLVFLTSCGEDKVADVVPVIDESAMNVDMDEEDDDILTDEEIDKELEEIFNIY